MPQRENVLLIYCSDGRSSKPEEIRGNINHAIRLPGGLLFPNLCASSLLGGEQTFEMSAIDSAIQLRINQLMSCMTPATGFAIGELIILLAAKAMVDLKSPLKIILMTHTHCGAADKLGLTEAQVYHIYATWKEKFETYFPGVVCEVPLLDRHSECGEHRYGHERVIAAV